MKSGYAKVGNAGSKRGHCGLEEITQVRMGRRAGAGHGEVTGNWDEALRG